MEQRQYILFDLDGTLSDPAEGIVNSLLYSLGHFGIEAEPQMLKKFIGPPLVDSFQKYFGFDREQTEQAVKFYREHFHDQGLFQNEIYPGIAELLSDLHAQGKRLAVATTKPTIYARQVLEYFEIDRYFQKEWVVGSFLDGTRTDKGELVGTVLELIGADQQLMVMVGDRKFDILGAKANGLESIGVAYGYAEKGELEKAGASVIVNTVRELRDLLLK